MDNLSQEFDLKFTPTPEQIADLFCSMDETEQAKFFNAIAADAENWKSPFCFQMQFLTDCPELTDAGRAIMADIGLYSTKPTTV